MELLAGIGLAPHLTEIGFLSYKVVLGAMKTTINKGFFNALSIDLISILL